MAETKEREGQDQRWANFFCEGSNGKYLRLWGPESVATMQLCSYSRKAALGSMKMHGCGCVPINLLTDTSVWTSYNSHVSQNNIIFCFAAVVLKVYESFLIHNAYKNLCEPDLVFQALVSKQGRRQNKKVQRLNISNHQGNEN